MSPLDPESHGAARAPTDQRNRYLMMVGLLSPKVQKRILAEGRTVSISAIQLLPLAWLDQETAWLQVERQ